MKSGKADRGGHPVLACILAAGLFSIPLGYRTAQATQLTAFVVPEFDQGTADLSAVTFVGLDYPPNSLLAKSLAGIDRHLEFFVNGTSDPDALRQLVAEVNNGLFDRGSPVTVTGMDLHYSGTIKGHSDSAEITLSVDILPKMTGFVLSKNPGGGHMVVDMNWRGLVVKKPLEIKSGNKTVEINSLAGLLNATVPEVSANLLSTNASRQLLLSPILDFSDIGNVDLATWHSLFDPGKILVSNVTSPDFQRAGSAKVISVYALGDCDLKQSCAEPPVRLATVSVNGAPVTIKEKTPLPNGQIQVAGYSTPEQVGHSQVLSVDLTERPVGTTDMFPLQVLAVFGGMMAAIATFVLFKARS